METSNFFHKLNLSRSKVIAVVVLLLVICCQAEAQKRRFIQRNNPNYDDRKISYGFLIGIHNSMLQVEHSDLFVTNDFDTLSVIQSDWSGGFSLGLIVNYKAFDFLDVRITPNVAFFEHRLYYQYTNGLTQEQLMETTMVQFPVLLKYKSARRGNIRMYAIGGVSPGLEASGRKNVDVIANRLELKDVNLTLEGGFGFDLYFPLFKFSPELRFSRGLVNVLGTQNNVFGRPLQRANTNTITLYLLFQ